MPVILSAVIIVFVAVELLFLPWLAQAFLYTAMVAGAWMGLAVKSDGGAVASGAITDSLIRAKALADLGIKWEEGWMLMAATTTKFLSTFLLGHRLSARDHLVSLTYTVNRPDNREHKSPYPNKNVDKNLGGGGRHEHPAFFPLDTKVCEGLCPY